MFNVHQHWDPLKVCIVGKSYSPDFYKFITNSKVRNVMEKIAIETEEDYQSLITLLKSFGVEVLRPDVTDDYKDYLKMDGKIVPPPMTPRDFSAMVGSTLYFKKYNNLLSPIVYENLKGNEWPTDTPKTIDEIPEWVKKECMSQFPSVEGYNAGDPYTKILDYVREQGNIVSRHPLNVNAAMTTRIGKDLYIGTYQLNDDVESIQRAYQEEFQNYRCHVINTGGHSDSTFCPVKPGLIVSLKDAPTYSETFPDWEVVYLPNQHWSKVKPFLELKEKNKGKWWVPGEELNGDFTEYVESWLTHWVGYVEETVFDINMLAIDEKTVICNNYNEQVFEAFSRHGVTPHVLNFRHRYFWDGGLHCITSDLHREGTMKDYFPNRG